MRSLSAAVAIACLACAEPVHAGGRGRAGTGTGTTASAGTERPPAPVPEATPRAVFEVPGIGDVAVRVELASTPAARARGLMYRRVLEADAGMLFLYPYARPRSFWMRNTYLSLDMIFVGRDRRVIGVIERAEPLSEEPCAVEGAAQFVVEVNAGFARAHGIFAGVPVRFEDVADLAPGAAQLEDDPEEDDEETEGWVE